MIARATDMMNGQPGSTIAAREKVIAEKRDALVKLVEPFELDDEQVKLAVEMDGRFRAATLDAPHGWITFESYGDRLADQRNARRQAGIWSQHPDPPPFPIGHEYEEYYAGMRAMRKWKQHLAVKRDYSQARSVL